MLKNAINCINPNIISIYKKSADLESMNDKILKHLPSSVRTQVSIASYDKGVLVLCYHNNAISNELRFLLPELRSKLRSNEMMYTLVNIKTVYKP